MTYTAGWIIPYTKHMPVAASYNHSQTQELQKMQDYSQVFSKS